MLKAKFRVSKAAAYRITKQRRQQTTKSISRSHISLKKVFFSHVFFLRSSVLWEPEYDTLCLLAYRQICLVPIRIVLSLDDVKELLPQILDSVKKLILATPDITIRKLAVQIIDIISVN
uniref:HEAT repeat-containing protein 1 n=1 Tax=Angiostrongylus cantonensis TaxID=6313 RepID=A0A0K0DB98_ANGCA